jgi:hypothetical protein
MAGEATTSTTANDIYFAAWVGDTILDEPRPYNVSKALMKFEGRKPTKAFDFPIQDDPGAAAAWSELADYVAADGYVGQTVTSLTTSKATATASMFGIAALVTDVIDAIANIDAVSHFSQVLGRSVEEKVESTVAAQYDNYSNATTASTVLLLDDFMAAIGALQAREIPGMPLVAVLHPKQVSDLRRDLTGTVAASFFGSPAGSSVASDVVNAKNEGRVGNIAGVDIFQTTAIPNAAGDHKGGMFVAGVTNGLYEVWDARTESHRDPLQPGTVLTCSVNFGVAEIRDAWGQEIASDT